MGSDLFDRLCQLNGTTRREVLIKNRNGSVAMKRHIICYLMREVGQFSFPCIGSFINRDHSTIMHSCGLVRRRIAASTEFAKTICRMRDQVMELIREVAA
jgi:chromosomal replication initiation ATPase DnaA